MIQIKLRKNLRIFDNYDTDFYIKAGEVKELNDRLLKSYSIKSALMRGDLILVDGDIEFKFKDSLFKVCSDNPNDGIFLFADKTMMVKDLPTNTFKKTAVTKPTIVPVAPKPIARKPFFKGGSLSTKKPKEELKTHGKTK